ncbi:hypothetical protein [Amycolatopsis sp. w19]|uniref:hypothetical protein n=1 Tax=Amycolatopsis sp. w19 TaxID=3448134 RepID=UPI003F1D78D2
MALGCRYLDRAIAAAAANVDDLRRKAGEAAVVMTEAMDLLTRRVALPSVAEAATPGSDLVGLCRLLAETTTNQIEQPLSPFSRVLAPRRIGPAKAC